MDRVLSAFPVEDDAEVSIEIDPRVTSDEHMDALRDYGFNRISLGVQDFDPRVQTAIHRHQTVEEVRHLVDRARNDDVDGINFDLIYGLPHQNQESFQTTINHVTAIRPDRIALYGYDVSQPMLSICIPYDEGEPSAGNGTMVAIRAGAPEDCDAMYAKAIELGATCDGPPGERFPGFFYGGYVRDPDGNKLCFCQIGPSQ